MAKYQEKYGEIPNQFAADAYDCVYAYYQALDQRQARPPTWTPRTLCDLMIQQFTTMTFNGLTGEWHDLGQHRRGVQAAPRAWSSRTALTSAWTCHSRQHTAGERSWLSASVSGGLDDGKLAGAADTIRVKPRPTSYLRHLSTKEMR